MRLGAPPAPGGVPNGGRGASFKSGRRATRTWMTGIPTARALVRSFWQLAMSAAPLNGTTGRLPLMSSFCRSWSINAQVLGLITTSAIYISPICLSPRFLVFRTPLYTFPQAPSRCLLAGEYSWHNRAPVDDRCPELPHSVVWPTGSPAWPDHG